MKTVLALWTASPRESTQLTGTGTLAPRKKRVQREKAHLSVLDVRPVLRLGELQVQVEALPLLARQLLPQLCSLLLRRLVQRRLRHLGVGRHPALQLLNLPAFVDAYEQPVSAPYG